MYCIYLWWGISGSAAAGWEEEFLDTFCSMYIGNGVEEQALSQLRGN